jgi:hypothetical protein
MTDCLAHSSQISFGVRRTVAAAAACVRRPSDGNVRAVVTGQSLAHRGESRTRRRLSRRETLLSPSAGVGSASARGPTLEAAPGASFGATKTGVGSYRSSTGVQSGICARLALLGTYLRLHRHCGSIIGWLVSGAPNGERSGLLKWHRGLHRVPYEKARRPALTMTELLGVALFAIPVDFDSLGDLSETPGVRR